MSRAEERAKEAFPKSDWFNENRSAYIKGYEQAIEDAIAYLKANAEKYIVDCTPTYPDAPQELIIGSMLYEHLKQSLTGE